ncbi:MAG: glycosyltransferase [Acidobacteria bacterium]|nr:MAG: glycosyltransferase [Acidobacteriota bacterium]
MKSYRVLVVTNLWPTEADPGYGSFVQAQMESLRPLGVEFDTLFIDGRASRWNYLRAVSRMRVLLRKDRYDLVHAHFGLSGWVARCQLRVPVVVSFMGDDVLGRPRRNGSITAYGRFLQASSFVLARTVAASIVKSAEMKSKLGPASADIIPNGVDLNAFRPIDRNEACRALGIDPAKKYVVFPYDPEEQRKRYDLIQTAVEQARAQDPAIEMLHARSVPHERMPLYLNAARVLVLASIFEGSPNAVKEAMAVNLPVVAVDVGDVRELIDRTEGCFIVPREATPMAEKIVEVCRRGARTRGREDIARLAIEKVAERVVAVYARAVKMPKS